MKQELTDADAKLAEALGIKPSQIATGKHSVLDNISTILPDWVRKQTTMAQVRITKVMEMGEGEHWHIPDEVVDKVFDEFTIIGHYRKSRYKLGHCSYYTKEIQLNMANPSMNEKQGYRTLLHEYTHALQYAQFNRSGHNGQFWFYLHLFESQLHKTQFGKIMK